MPCETLRYGPLALEMPRLTGTELRDADMESWLIEDQIQIYRLFREHQTPLANDTVERLTGRKPKTFSEFAQDYASAFR